MPGVCKEKGDPPEMGGICGPLGGEVEHAPPCGSGCRYRPPHPWAAQLCILASAVEIPSRVLLSHHGGREHETHIAGSRSPHCL